MVISHHQATYHMVISHHQATYLPVSAIIRLLIMLVSAIIQARSQASANDAAAPPPQGQM